MTKYWVLGTGTWDATDKTHWSDQSGGMGGANVPTSTDDVRINNLSGGGTVTLGATGNCRSLDCTGFGGTLDMATQALNVGSTDGGAFVLAVNPMTFHSSPGAVINFVATSDHGGVGWDITTFGKGLPELKFDGAGGKWTVQDSLNTVSDTVPVTLTRGELNTNAKTCAWGRFSSNGTDNRTLSLGILASTVTLRATGTVWDVTSSLILNPGISTISISDIHSDQKVFKGGGRSYYNVSVKGGASDNFLLQDLSITNDLTVVP